MQKARDRIGFNQLSGPLQFLVIVSWIGVVLFAILFLIGMLAYFGTLSPDKSSQAETTSNDAQLEAPVSLHMESITVRAYGTDNVEVLGEVENNGSVSVANVQLSINCYDTSKTLVGTTTTYTQNAVYAGQKSSFRAVVPTGPSDLVAQCEGHIIDFDR